MSSSRLSYLLDRYAHHRCSESERLELFLLIEETTDEELERQLRAAWMDLEPHIDIGQGRSREILEQILSSDSPEKLSWQGRLSAGARGRRMRYVLAAAACAVILVVGYFMSNPTPGPAPVARIDTLIRDVLPGGNRAVLTLANGQKVLLDEKKNGQLARQGSSSVVKISNGLLAYDVRKGRQASKEVKAVTYNTLATPKGGQYQIVLPDGTKVWLNAASSLRYPTAFLGKERCVDVTGEAFFEVASQPDQPFTVRVGSSEVKVLGTQFNINAYGDRGRMSATLVSGRLCVTSGGHRQLLDPGEAAKVNSEGSLILAEHADIEEATAWKKGLFYFHNADLKTIMRQLSRWYDVEVVYYGADTGRRFNGQIYRSLTLSEVLQVLHLGNIRFKIEGKTLNVFI
jgi:ferric-dicitrate binding protein FerR (iron transport regulator)